MQEKIPKTCRFGIFFVTSRTPPTDVGPSSKVRSHDAGHTPAHSHAWRIYAFFGTPLPLKGGFPPKKKVKVVAK
jgi:hypothetical protein